MDTSDVEPVSEGFEPEELERELQECSMKHLFCFVLWKCEQQFPHRTGLEVVRKVLKQCGQYFGWLRRF